MPPIITLDSDQPSGFSGPAHWLGNPAVVAQCDSLHVGYYIERGLDRHDRPEYIVTPEWHWHALLACFDDPERRQKIDAVLQQVPPPLRQVSAFCGDRVFEPPYEGEPTLLGLKQFGDGCPPNEWIDAYLGARFGLDACLTQQERLVDNLVSPILRGEELEAIVLEMLQASLGP